MTGLEATASTDPGEQPVVLVTGASRGIGAATAAASAALGARVVLVARSPEGLQATASAITARGGQAVAMHADLSAAGTGQRIIEDLLHRFGRLDAVVNNAATLGPICPLGAADEDQLDRAFDLNVHAPMEIIRAALPALRTSGGRVLNVSSSAADTAIAGLGVYCVTKSALAMATRVLALEETQVTFLLVQPGPVDTGMHEALRNDGTGMDPDRRAYYHRLRDDGQLASPEVPAAAFAWLARHGPNEWSGRELSHDDDEVMARTHRTGGPDV